MEFSNYLVKTFENVLVIKQNSVQLSDVLL